MKYQSFLRTFNLTKARLTKVKALVDLISHTEDSPLEEVEKQKLLLYQAETQLKKAEFEKNLKKLLDSSTLPADYDETLVIDKQDELDELCIAINSRIKTTLAQLEDDNSSVHSHASSAHAHPQPTSVVRLPKIELKHFSGDPQTWISFINLFDTTIHSNPTLSQVTKFQYLLGTLSGEALNLIKSLPLSDANYTIAYNSLRERYHSIRRLTSLHINKIIDLSPTSSISVKHLRVFVNAFKENSQALSALNCDLTQNNPLLVTLLLRKLDSELRNKFETTRVDSQTFPEVDEVIKFLSDYCAHVEDSYLHVGQLEPKHNKSSTSSSPTYKVNLTKTPSRPVALVTTSTSTPSREVPCFACLKTDHKIYSCPVFKEKFPKERFDMVKSNHRCTSCLGNHGTRKCNSKYSCMKCQGKHHTLLHFDAQKSESSKPDSSTVQLPPTSQAQTNIVGLLTNFTSQPTNSTVLLATVLVKLVSHEGNTHVFRALIDSCSQCNFITEYAAQLLGVKRCKSHLNISGIAQSQTYSKGQCYLHLENLSGKIISKNTPMLILDQITTKLPKAPLSTELIHMVTSFTLADPSFHTPGPVDVLLGGSIFPYIFTGENHRLGPNLPVVMSTEFGYTLMGPAPCVGLSHNSTAPQLNTLLSISDLDLHTSIQRFWQQEEPPSSSKPSKEDILCEEHFSSTHTRESSGRYCVRLPFKPEHPPLGSSIDIAKKRFSSLETGFQAKPQFRNSYVEFMEDYLNSGHMKPCPTVPDPHFFLPHHGVLKESSSTTKLRTVFDASSKSTTNTSLNDIILTGPKLQVNIFDILFHFREHKIVVTCDIRQMYRQINIHSDDQKYQLILWRTSPSLPLSVYALTTVTYGLSCSPFLALRVLQQLAEDEQEAFPRAASVLRSTTYVDDVVFGQETEEKALELQSELVELLKKGCFELRKWTSNSPKLLSSMPEAHCETPKFLQNSDKPYFSVLGLYWSSSVDCFSYDLQLSISTSNTKRQVLAIIAKISYDPCGFLSPVIMWTKIFMQLLWTKGFSWDEQLPQDVLEPWNLFLSQLGTISDITLPRSFSLNHSSSIQIHGFSDASERGYGAVVYLRCSNEDSVHISQVISKTRVAPLKQVSLPRLELCGSHLLAKLISHIVNLISTRYHIDRVYAWCDSTIVLSWLQTPPYRLKTFVANRVSEIQESVPAHLWAHVSSLDNPADCISRGLMPSELKDHPLWWTGPSWLCEVPSMWPTSQFIISTTPDSLQETKPENLTVLTSIEEPTLEFLHKFSSWTKLIRVFSYVLRFIINVRSPDKKKDSLTVTDLKVATLRIFKHIQETCFKDDLRLLKAQRPCSTRLQRISPFIDESGLIRVGGRLTHSNLQFSVKHPIILPKKHHLVNLLVDHFHLKYLHAPPQLLQSLLAQEVWILSARSVVRSRVFQCIKCFRAKPRNQTPFMGNLPKPRITPSRPFLETGIDFCGPFTAKSNSLRSIRHLKLYICIFICFSTKAVHIETVSDLSSDAFIAALSRFVSRRGLCRTIYCDNGTNFVGANSHLSKATIAPFFASREDKRQILAYSTQNSIEFKFNPPAAPHQGGLWEAAVKSAKYHLRRVIGESVLTIEEFNTITVKVEAILNSRPLIPLSADPADITALTPGHFLIGAPLTALPEDNVEEVPLNRLKRWHRLQAMTQQLWRRWSRDYLHTLQQKGKWTKQVENLKIGDLVIVEDARTSPLSWPLARIASLHPGSDNVVRVVQLQTKNGVLTRPAVKVFPLPVGDTQI